MKYLIIEDKKKINDITKYLIERLGLPKIQRRLNIYSLDKDIQIELLNNRILLSNLSKRKNIYIKNKNIKQFFKYLESNNKNGFTINEIELLDYGKVRLLFNTYHGDVLAFDDLDLCEDVYKEFKLKGYDDINDHKQIVEDKKELLFDKMGNLNSKIKNYAKKTGLDIRSCSESLRIRLSNISNDYSHVEKYFKLVSDEDLLSIKSNCNKNNELKNMSIIIPLYNQDVIPTLLSIQGQSISKKDKEKLQVIIVNDGSSKDYVNSIDSIKCKLDYELDIISFEKNMGLSNARNAGISIAKYDKLMFIDSDIVLSKNFIYDVNIRLQIIPNAIFVAMRKNIDKNSSILKEENLLKGINHTSSLDDSRVITKSKEYHIGWDSKYKNDTISILDDSNYFKELSYGAKIGIYDLPAVVTGHNISVNKSQILHSPVFSTEFKGWGMEDSYFASQMISNGCFVIPILSSCVFHINHPPRCGSMEEKRIQAEENYKRYNSLLDEDWV